jgi:hypothetical protein
MLLLLLINNRMSVLLFAPLGVLLKMPTTRRVADPVGHRATTIHKIGRTHIL